MNKELEVKKLVDLKDFLKNARDTKNVILPESNLEFKIKKIFQKELAIKTDRVFMFSMAEHMNPINSEIEIVKKQIENEKDKTKLKKLEKNLKVLNENLENQLKELFSKQDNADKFSKLVETTCKAFTVSPKLTDTDTGAENELYINYLSDQDLMFLYTKIQEHSGVVEKCPSNTKK